MKNENEPITPEVLIEKVNAPVIQGDQAQAIVATLAVIEAKREEMKTLARTFDCTTQADSDRAALVLKEIDADLKAVADALKEPKAIAHERHKLFTTLEKALTEAHGEAKAALKARVAAWVAEQRRKAAEEQARLQREADERARREREALEKKAAAMKTEAKQQEYRERAAEVVAPVVSVEAPKASGVRLSERWKATVTDHAAFLLHVAGKPDAYLSDGIVTISETKLAAAKTRYTALDVPGVRFDKVLG
jgi:hypothetical protein